MGWLSDQQEKEYYEKSEKALRDMPKYDKTVLVDTEEKKKGCGEILLWALVPVSILTWIAANHIF